MKKFAFSAALVVVIAIGLAAGLAADNDHSHFFHFAPDTLILSRSVYTGTAATGTIGETLPPGCVAGTILGVKVKCGTAIDNGEYPNLIDSHNVWNNDGPDGSFGVTSPIFLDNITPDGKLLDTLQVPSTLLVTSFSSKSELALNRSTDGKSITFMAYQGNSTNPTDANLLDVSNSNTPGVFDATNPVVSSYYRAVAEVDDDGRIRVTDGNAYSGNNGRAAIKANWLYYTTGNANNGGLTPTNVITSTGVELLVPGQAPGVPTQIGTFTIAQYGYAADKPGKDNNFRGLTIFDDTLYVTKGSGSNGLNTVYQVGTGGTLPTVANAPGGNLANVPITVLPGFPITLAKAADVTTIYPFGIWFANANTLYVADEGDGVVADAGSTKSQAGLQKWSLTNGTWHLDYILTSGLDLGVPYGVPGYPVALNPATDGLRNMTGRVNRNGTVTIWAVTSTVSANGDQGADPNKLVKITDVLSATTLPTSDGDHDKDDSYEHFVTIRAAGAGEVLRGVSFAPADRDDHDRDDHDRGDHGHDR